MLAFPILAILDYIGIEGKGCEPWKSATRALMRGAFDWGRASEDVDFPDETFDVITSCQCFWYFDHPRIMPKLWRMLKPGGSLLVLYMAWLRKC